MMNNNYEYVPVEIYENVLICEVYYIDIITKERKFLGNEAFKINDFNLTVVEQVKKYETLILSIKNVLSSKDIKTSKETRKVLLDLLEECDELHYKNRKRL